MNAGGKDGASEGTGIGVCSRIDLPYPCPSTPGYQLKMASEDVFTREWRRCNVLVGQAERVPPHETVRPVTAMTVPALRSIPHSTVCAVRLDHLKALLVAGGGRTSLRASASSQAGPIPPECMKLFEHQHSQTQEVHGFAGSHVHVVRGVSRNSRLVSFRRTLVPASHARHAHVAQKVDLGTTGVRWGPCLVPHPTYCSAAKSPEHWPCVVASAFPRSGTQALPTDQGAA